MPPLRKKTAAQTGTLQGKTGAWQPCILTWYDPALGGTNSASGKPDPHSGTSSGEPYDPNKDTCAAPPAYAFGTMLTFSYSGTTVTCRVNDRGGAIQGAHFDLSRSAAQKLGIINAGVVNAQFQVGSSSGAPPAAQGSGGPPATGSGGGGSPLQAIEDLLTGNFSDLAVMLAEAAVTVVKDIGLGIGDWIVIPWWHWNQRAAQYYVQEELFSQSEDKWTVMPWTAAFWGFGYWLFWTDPESKSMLKPAPVRNSRAARHMRGLQSIPARKSLVKPKDVKEKTAKKPPVITSRAPVLQTGTMSATRHVPVRVTGTHANGETTRSEVPVSRAGTLPGSREKVSSNETSEPHSRNRPRNGSSPDSPGAPSRDSGTGSRSNGHRA